MRSLSERTRRDTFSCQQLQWYHISIVNGSVPESMKLMRVVRCVRISSYFNKMVWCLKNDHDTCSLHTCPLQTCPGYIHARYKHALVTYMPVTYMPVTYMPVTNMRVTYMPVTNIPVTYMPIDFFDVFLSFVSTDKLCSTTEDPF